MQSADYIESIPSIKALPEFDASQTLDRDAAVAAYLTDILEANDPAFLAAALGDIARYNFHSTSWRGIMNFSIECEQETDGRWIAEVPQLPGVLCYGKTADEAMAKTEALALRAMAERLEQNESRPVAINISLPLAA